MVGCNNWSIDFEFHASIHILASYVQIRLLVCLFVAIFLYKYHPYGSCGESRTIRQYAGFSTAEESNLFYRRNLAAGQQVCMNVCKFICMYVCVYKLSSVYVHIFSIYCVNVHIYQIYMYINVCE